MTATRNHFATTVAACGLILGLAGCASSTKFTSTWKEPGVGPTDLTGKKVAVFVISSQESLRRAAEASMAAEITARGAEGVAGYTLMSADQARDKDAAAAVLAEGNFDALITLHAVDSSQETSWVPGTSYAAWPGYYGTWGGYWGYGWGMAYDPGYLRTDTVVTVETMIYDVPGGHPIWAGRSETTNPEQLDTAVHDLAEALDDELVKSGLLRQ